jgi:prophage DNA circulation protein
MSGVLGALGAISQGAQSVRSIATSTSDLFGLATQVVGNARTIDNTGNSWSGGQWWQQLQPGSWRGVGFVLDAGQTAAGRRIALHEYPYRDDAWAEDLGKLPRRFMVQAFLVGDDVYQQRDAMLRVVEQSGAGTLVHPTLGSIQCVLLEFSSTDRRERGRYVELQFAFILAGDVQYPTTAIATGSAVTSAAAVLNSVSRGDLGSALAQITSVPIAAIASVQQFTGLATRAVSDASQIVGAVRGLAGGYHGRFANGALSTLHAANATVSGLLGAATTTRSAVFAAADSVNRVASFL